MRKLLLLSSILLCATMGLHASPVSESTALRVGRNFMLSQRFADADSLQLVYAVPLARHQHPACYVFACPAGGFVIVAADDVATPVWGYSTESVFQPQDVPCNVLSLLGSLAGQLDAALTDNVPAEESTLAEWKSLLEAPAPVTAVKTVGPLLSTKWNQISPYNALCPKDSQAPSGYGGRVPCGCVATAMAQVVRYHKYPTAPRGWHQYTSSYGKLTADFDNTTFSFSGANMPDNLSSSSSTAAKNMVSTLIYRCGVAVDMQYKPNGSGAVFRDAMSALVNHFRCDATTIGCATRDSKYTVAQWESMLKKELDAKRPMLYDGRPEVDTTGHAFVCDGYKSDGTFHFNFGWGGPFNGYFKVTALKFKDYGNDLHDYTFDQSVVLGIKPASSSNILLMHSKEESRYTVSDTLMLYNMHALNNYEYAYKYNSAGYRYAVFEPANPSDQLVVEVVSDKCKSMSLYDGTLAGSLIYMAKKGNNIHTPDSQMVTAQHKLTVIDSGNYAAYALRIFVDKGLRRVQHVRADALFDTVRLRWSEQGNATHWQVEYGPQGFSHGYGTVLDVEDTSLLIAGLPYDKPYDYYVRSRVATQYGAWSAKKTYALPRPDWTVVVTAQPDGFLYDADSNITISSTQALAWLVSVVNGLNGQQAHSMKGHTVRLASDISMDPYAWIPLKDFAGTFDGGGHSLSAIRIAAGTSPSGMFASISDPDALLLNIHLDSAEVQGGYNSGMLVGELDGRLESCSVQGTLTGKLSNCGGLVGLMYGGSIRNSMARVDMGSSSGSETGGLVGTVNCFSSDSARIENCCAAGQVAGSFNVGGFIGRIQGNRKTVVANCYSACQVSYDSFYTFYSNGMFIASLGKKGQLDYCYALASGLPMIGKNAGSAVADTASFVPSVGSLQLLHPVCIDGDTATRLLPALDAWVSQQADTTLRSWVADSLPQLAAFYAPTCGMVEGFVAVGTGYDEVYLQWQDLEGVQWRLEYMPAGTPRGQGVYAEVDTPQIALTGLQPGGLYDVYLRTLCQEGSRSPWVHHTFRVCDTAVHHSAVKACDRYVWLGDTLVHSTSRFDTLAAQSGCDSVVSLELTVHPSSVATDSVSVCDQYQGPEGHLTESGLYTTDTVNAQGCDSLHLLVLTVRPISHTADTLVVCDSVRWHGTLFTDSVADCEFDTVDSYGCDSVLMLHLTVHSSTRSLSTLEACDSLLWHGTVYRASTDSARFDTVNPFGCPHAELLSLTLHHSHLTEEKVDACDSYYWPAADTVLTASGTYADTLSGPFACDSIAILHLALHHNNPTTDTLVVCDSVLWHGNVYTATSDSYLFDTVDAYGCDSAVWLQLTVKHSTSHSETFITCDSMRWHGTTYTIPVADATFDTVNSQGCPHEEHMSLVLYYTTFRHDTVEACDEYYWPPANQWFDTDGYYTDTLSGKGGCDSICSLQLTIHSASQSVDSVVACDSVVWHGSVYYNDYGDPKYDTLNRYGCDSTVSLALTIHHSHTYTLTVTTPASEYMWMDSVYTQSGTYTDTIATVQGCDSVVVLVLILTGTGFAPAGQPSLAVWPNPVHDMLQIEAEGLLSVEVYDAAGRMVLDIASPTVPMQQLPEGTYMLLVHTQAGSVPVKVIKR